MDWVHCNNCFKTPNAENTFYMTACGHVLCKKCARQDTTGTPGMEDNCRVCKVKTKFLEINRNLKADLQIYFRDPKDLACQYMTKLKTVLDFQERQRHSYKKMINEKYNRAAKSAKEFQITLKKRSEIEKQMLAERSELKAEIKNLETKLAEKDQEIEQLKLKTMSDNNNNHHFGSQKKYPSLNGTTPMRLLSFNKVPQSTPLDQINARRKIQVQEKNRSFFADDSMLAGSDVGVTTPVMLGIKRSINPRSPFTPSKRLFD